MYKLLCGFAQSVITRLESMGQRNGALITKLQGADEEMLDGLENVSVTFVCVPIGCQ